MDKRNWLRGLGACAVLVAAVAVVGLLWPATDKGGRDASASETTTTTTVVGKKECFETWGRVDADKGKNRWFANGIPAIAAARTPEEARAAAHEWMAGVRTDPVLLAGGVQYVLHVTVDQKTLFDADGCATQAAVDLGVQMETALALSHITPSEAPADGHNSGTHDGAVVGAANSGVTGDRKAILVELPDGTKIWIMARCGNPVTQGPPPVPHGPTDNPPPVNTTTTTTPPGKPLCPGTDIPVPPNGLCPKDATKDINRNPNVPPGVTKTGPSPDNGSRVGAGPTAPVDSPCGKADCSTTTTAPSSSSSGGTTTVPSCGKSGQPSCHNTGVTPPTTVAPPPAPPVTSSPTVTVVSP